jgi:transcriptional regulator with XRE-family HTH domain
MKFEEKLKARDLRKNKGMSIKDIAKEVGVSKSSVSLWVRDIELTIEQKKKLEEKNRLFFNQEYGNKVKKEKYKKIRGEYQVKGRKKAMEENNLHCIGCMLYWGEGDKSRTNFGFVNSDPGMIRVMMRFLRECYSVEEDRFTLRILYHEYSKVSLKETENYWLNITGLKNSCLRAPIVRMPVSSKKKKKNKLTYGVCTVRVSSSVALLQNIYGAIQEYSGEDNPKFIE